MVYFLKPKIAYLTIQCTFFTHGRKSKLSTFFLLYYRSTSLAITKIDVLDDFDEIKVAVDYKIDGEVLPSFPGMEILFDTVKQ